MKHSGTFIPTLKYATHSIKRKLFESQVNHHATSARYVSFVFLDFSSEKEGRFFPVCLRI